MTQRLYLLLFLLLAGTVVSQAPCGEMRPATAREIEFHTRVMAVFARVLPSGPLEWQITEQTPSTPLALVAADAGWHPMPVHYEVTWSDMQRKKLAALDEKQTLRTLEKAQEERARVEAQKKLDRLMNEREETVKGGDPAATQTLDREIENLTAEVQKEKTWIDDPAENKADELRGSILRITLDVNLFTLPVTRANSEDILLPVQAQVYRLADGFDSSGRWQEGCTIILLGRGWRLFEGTPTVMRSAEPVGLLSTNAYTLVVRIQGDEARALDYIKAIDWLTLEAMLFK
jgi:hypothetical protein